MYIKVSNEIKYVYKTIKNLKNIKYFAGEGMGEALATVTYLMLKSKQIKNRPRNLLYVPLGMNFISKEMRIVKF